jgi:hypothetical protein
MRRFATALSIVTFSISLLSTAAFAKVNFRNVSATVTIGDFRTLGLSQSVHGGLWVTFTETGLGSNAGTNYLVTADASATYVCANNGGNTPNAANKETFSGPVSGSATFTSDGNGRVSGAIAVAPLDAGAFACPPGQGLHLYSVSYTNVILQDTTNGVTYALEGTFSRTFPLP